MTHRPKCGRYTPLLLWRGCFTRRWHMNPDMSHTDDMICGHQGRCAILLLALFPSASPDLLKAAVTHDMAEFVVGDLAAPFKQAGGDLVARHQALEAEELAQMGLAVELSLLDADRLKLVDRLDAYLFTQLRAPHLLQRDGWRRSLTDIFEMSNDLKVWGAVFSMIEGGAS